MSARSFDINKLNVKQSNIRVIVEGSTKCVKLHDSVIFAVDNQGFTLASFGWRTNTTKTAINRALQQLKQPYCVAQVKGIWYICYKGEKLTKFEEGISFNLE